jgi:hypothetical protein
MASLTTSLRDSVRSGSSEATINGRAGQEPGYSGTPTEDLDAQQATGHVFVAVPRSDPSSDLDQPFRQPPTPSIELMDHRGGKDPRSLAGRIPRAVWRHLKAIIEAALSFPTGR